MPSVTMKFKLPEEQREHMTAVMSVRLLAAVEDFQSKMRSISKHGMNDTVGNGGFKSEHAAFVLRELNNTIDNHGVMDLFI